MDRIHPNQGEMLTPDNTVRPELKNKPDIIILDVPMSQSQEESNREYYGHLRPIPDTTISEYDSGSETTTAEGESELKLLSPEEMRVSLKRFIDLDREKQEIESKQTKKKDIFGHTTTVPELPHDLFLERMKLYSLFMANKSSMLNSPLYKDIFKEFEQYNQEKRSS